MSVRHGGRVPDPAVKASVALVHCPDYDESRVLAALRRGVGLLGGIGRFCAAGENILLKPNLLIGAAPEKNVTTHPAVLKAMGLLLQEAGAKVRFGDSPGIGSASGAAAKAGLTAAAREIGMEQADLSAPVQVSFNEALIAKQLVLSRAALAADGIVSLAKMKTHGFMRITGAVKNQFGCVPGIRKGEYHVKMPSAEHFAAMLVDINRYLRSRLYVLDGIVAMEGNGPGSGTPRKMNLLLLSSDPVALDAVFCRLVRLPAEFVPTMKPGAESGLGTWNDSEIEVLRRRGFPAGLPRLQGCPPAGRRFRPLVPLLSEKMAHAAAVHRRGAMPRLRGLHRGLPAGAQGRAPGRANGKPVYDYERCIRCYCCQEMCPHGAIAIRRPLLSRLIHR